MAGCGGGDDGGSDEVAGTDADDKLTGTDGDDKLDAGAGEDVVQGGAGNDEITGGDDPDFLYGGDGDDRFLASEDDAVDVHDCGEGEDVVTEPDARDQLFPTCETVHWTNRPPGEPYENTMSVGAETRSGCARVRRHLSRRLHRRHRAEDVRPTASCSVRAASTWPRASPARSARP